MSMIEASQTLDNKDHTAESSTTSPASISSLPDDIISRIFHASIPQALIKNGAPFYGVIPAFNLYFEKWKVHPYWIRSALMGVNTRWHKLITSNPDFWCTLIIDPAIPGNQEKLEKTLHYAGEYPLTVIIRPQVSTARRCPKAINLVRKHLYRIESLHICRLYRDEYETLFPLFKEDVPISFLPSLKTLQLPGYNTRPLELGEFLIPSSLVLGRIHAPILENVIVQNANEEVDTSYQKRCSNFYPVAHSWKHYSFTINVSLISVGTLGLLQDGLPFIHFGHSSSMPIPRKKSFTS
ncbi:hypothetical protein M422DRAFT_274564 [Sphaerobolus stellatus SS14]|uniref:F-box domain-containing protein n=1 Tax=Sphaerobolus stellatus (strain SS14) TaxID=990650 RepID=A0A0C9UGP6_SPHS4|nr:hypothetical protein M422DRAFT_274564 [Sphaerobolus stellatus SS14]